MLYTVRPLERVYADPETFSDRRKAKSENRNIAGAEFKEVLLPNGRIVTRRDGENYIIERINSTDMKDYLNDDYVPGKSMKD